MSLLSSWLASSPPDAAVEIAPGRVSAAALAPRGTAAVTAHAAEPLPPGAVVPGLTGTNLVDRGAVVAALRRLFDKLGARHTRVALMLPDPVARVSILRFDQVPPRAEDLDQLIRWQVRKSTPFPIDEACVTATPGARTGASSEFLVAVARRDVVGEYEAVCEAAGAYAGLVDLSTLNVINLCLAGASPLSGDTLLVHVRPGYTSLAITRERDVIFYRTRAEGEDESLPDLVHQTAMYYQDRLAGLGFARVLLNGGGRGPGALDVARRALEDRLGARVEPLDVTRVVSLPDRVSPGDELCDVLAPLAGVLLRARRGREAVRA